MISIRTNHIMSIWTPKGRHLTCRKGEVDLARAAALPVLFVDPKGCPECGVIDDKNRSNQAIFSCRRLATLATLM
jgi:hypothetical protein